MWWLLPTLALAGPILMDRETPHGHVVVRETEDAVVLELDGHPQSAWHPADPTATVYRYTDVLLGAVPDEPGDALVIGLGGGTLSKALHRSGWTVEAVEINRAVAVAARRHFGLPREVTVHLGDGRAFAEEADQDFDLIILDAASEAGFAPPLFTASFYATLTGRLSDGGRILVNSWEDAPWADAELATWATTGPVAVAPVPEAGNRVIIAGDLGGRSAAAVPDALPLTDENVRERVIEDPNAQ